MLILTRRPGESIIIGDDIVVTVLSVFGSQVKLGIVAPAETAVDREEVRARKEKDADTPHGPHTLRLKR